MAENIDADIKIAEEFIKKDYEPWSFYEKQGDELFELQVSIKNILKALKSYREDYNHRCQLAINRKKELDNYKEAYDLETIERAKFVNYSIELNEELEKYKKIAEKLADKLAYRLTILLGEKVSSKDLIEQARKEVENGNTKSM